MNSNPNAIPESEYPKRTAISVREFALKKMAEHGLIADGWKFVFNTRTKNRLGQCQHRNKTIELSVYHMRTHIMAQVVDTIMHEIAHALCGRGVGHGAEWKRKAYELGATPQAKARVELCAEYKEAAKDKKVPVFLMKTGDGVERYVSQMSMSMYARILSGRLNPKNVHIPKNKALTMGRMYPKLITISEIESYPKLAF